MHLLRCVFFIEAVCGFSLSVVHVAGIAYDLADDLSHERLSSFLRKVPSHCVLGLAPSTNKAYRTAINRFSTKYNISTPFPVNELLLCRFVTALAEEGLAPATIKTYGCVPHPDYEGPT